tara:strand:- start:10290 stop:10661 length:372 start_codon:yes stop_codon:yes gene_type:complete
MSKADSTGRILHPLQLAVRSVLDLVVDTEGSLVPAVLGLSMHQVAQEVHDQVAVEGTRNLSEAAVANKGRKAVVAMEGGMIIGRMHSDALVEALLVEEDNLTAVEESHNFVVQMGRPLVYLVR